MKRGYSKGLICRCGGPMSDRARRCKPCLLKELAADPERGKKIGLGIKRHLEDPANYARHLERAKRAGITKSRDLDFCERAAKRMREQIQPLSMLPENLAKRDNALSGRLSAEAKLAWCPQEMRARYSYLTNTKVMRRAQARPIVLAEWADILAVRSGQIDDAIRWLNRIAPTRKLDDGTYQYGNGILRAGELIERAKLKGWEPERLAA